MLANKKSSNSGYYLFRAHFQQQAAAEKDSGQRQVKRNLSIRAPRLVRAPGGEVLTFFASRETWPPVSLSMKSTAITAMEEKGAARVLSQ